MKKNLVRFIEKISYRKNVILIEFSRNMNLTKKDKEHSYLNFENYGFEVGRKINPFPKETKFEEIKLGFSVRFSLPSFFVPNIHENAILHLGYVSIRKIFYIESEEGYISNVCSIISLEKEIEELDLKNGNIEIIDRNTLKYSYNGENRFDKISINDFYILKQGQMYYPNSIQELNSKEFIISFLNPILNQIDKSVVLKVNKKPLTKDVYGFSIKEDVEIPISKVIPATLTLFNFLNYQNKTAHLKLRFSKPIKFFDPTDFMIKYNNNAPKFINYLGVNNDRTIIDISVSNLDIDNIDNAIFEIFTCVNIEEVNTIDDDGEIVFIESKYTSSLFKTSNIDWVLKDYNFSKSIIKFQFSHAILPKSLITNYSVFEGNKNSWNGEKLTIKTGNLNINYDSQNSNNEAKISLKDNESFGEIILKYKENFKAIVKNMTNSKPCQIYIQNNNLFLEFNELEEMDGILVFIDNIKYIPFKDIQSSNENFIFYGYSATGSYSLDNIIYIEPLNGYLDNPFKGQKLYKNYIVALNDNKTFRDYGDDLNITEINGFLRVVGRLEEGIATLKKLKVSETIIIDASKTNVTLDNVECLGSAEVKTR